MSATPDVMILGGGIIGLACAEALATRALRVGLVDRDEIAGTTWRAASWASAGMIAPVGEALGEAKSAGHDDGRFLEVCRQSRDLWTTWAPALEDATGLDLDYDRSGALLVADQPDDPARLDRFESAAVRAGEPAERLKPEEVQRLLPDAAKGLDFGLRLAGEHRVDNRKVCLALLKRLRDLGVEIIRGEVHCIERAKEGGVAVQVGDARHVARRVLVTAGAWSAGIGGLPTLPVAPLRGQMLRLSGIDWPFQGCVRGGHYYAVRRRGPKGAPGDLLIGATEEHAGFDTRVTPGGLAQLTGWLRRVFPGLSDRPVTETWSGLRPSTPDGRPILDQVDDDVWVAAGHHRNGILLTPYTAASMASWIAEQIATAQQDLFALQRFAEHRVQHAMA